MEAATVYRDDGVCHWQRERSRTTEVPFIPPWVVKVMDDCYDAGRALEFKVNIPGLINIRASID